MSKFLLVGSGGFASSVIDRLLKFADSRIKRGGLATVRELEVRGDRGRDTGV